MPSQDNLRSTELIWPNYAHENLMQNLPIELEVTSLIFSFNIPISIKFRMDEKRFDVDGAYNARYEIVKKRIDKAHVEDSDERINQSWWEKKKRRCRAKQSHCLSDIPHYMPEYWIGTNRYSSWIIWQYSILPLPSLFIFHQTEQGRSTDGTAKLYPIGSNPN